MALIHCNFFSEALRMNTDINVIIPTPHPVENPLNPGNYFHEGAKYQTLYRYMVLTEIIPIGSAFLPLKNMRNLPN